MEEDDLQSLDWLHSFRLSGGPLSTLDENANEPALPDAELSKTRRRKPPQKPHHCQCTFSCLIFRAIEDSPQKSLPLQGIYDWILRRYPEFAQRGTQWQRSLRHSLSLNASFVRFTSLKGKDFGSRGCWWTVHPDYRKAYGSQVLRCGPQHRCLPRTGPNSKAPTPLHHSSSEYELAALEQDLRAAATICTLRHSPSDGSTPEPQTSPVPSRTRKHRRKNPTPVKRPKMSISCGAVEDEHCYTHTANGVENKSGSSSPSPPTSSASPSSPLTEGRGGSSHSLVQIEGSSASATTDQSLLSPTSDDVDVVG